MTLNERTRQLNSRMSPLTFQGVRVAWVTTILGQVDGSYWDTLPPLLNPELRVWIDIDGSWIRVRQGWRLEPTQGVVTSVVASSRKLGRPLGRPLGARLDHILEQFNQKLNQKTGSLSPWSHLSGWLGLSSQLMRPLDERLGWRRRNRR